MSRRVWSVVAGSVFVLLSVAGGFLAGTIRSADASVRQPGGRPAPKICWHDELSVWRCGGSDSSRVNQAEYGPALPSSEIQDISVTIRPKEGRPITLYLPATTDAIFFGRAPVENFLLRYYEATRQRAAANRLRSELLSWEQRPIPRPRPR